MATYTVKKGDELNKIGSQFGVDPSTITGYKSGNPDLIYEGETLNIPDKSTNSTYASEVKSQLSGDSSGSTGSTDTGTKSPYDVYGVDTLRTNLKDTQAKKDEAFKSLQGAQTKLFNDEYATSGLADKKAKLTTLDQEIADLKGKRDQIVGGIRGNSNLSVSQMSGDIKKSADYYNNLINDKISERNGVATEYNNGLGEIDKKVSRTLADKKLDYDKYASDESSTSKKITEYISALKSALVEEGRNKRYDKQLANALEIAKLRKAGGSTKLTPIINKYSQEIMGWYDSAGNRYDADRNLIDGETDTTPPADTAEDPFATAETTPATADGYEGDGSENDLSLWQRIINALKGQ